MHDTRSLLRPTDFPPLRRRGLTTLQVNLSHRCNQSHLHCHVNAGPGRTERMDDADIALIPQVLAPRGLPTLDLTGDASLPPRQEGLEATYKCELWERHGIVFNRLLVLANMPIRRFGSTLVTRGQFADYLRLLKDQFGLANLGQVMCRDLISVDWQGRLFDCDFDQQLRLPLRDEGDGECGTGPHPAGRDQGAATGVNGFRMRKTGGGGRA